MAKAKLWQKKKEIIFIIYKLKKQRRCNRISKTGKWSHHENILLAVCFYMKNKLKQKWKDLYRYITTRSVKQIKNKCVSDFNILRKISNKFDSLNLPIEIINNENRIEIFNKNFDLMNNFLRNFCENKFFCQFNLEYGDIQNNIMPFLYTPEFRGLFNSTENLTIQISNEDYKILNSTTNEIPVLDYNTICDYLIKKYEI
jgi:hypothetical protein